MPHLQMLLVVSGTAWSVHEAHVLLGLAVHARAHVGVINQPAAQVLYCQHYIPGSILCGRKYSYYILA